MNTVYLIFRRDYLGYVKAWGFWLGLAAVPFFIVIGALFASFAAQSSPVRYYTVIEPGAVYADAIEAEFQRLDDFVLDQARDIADQMGQGAMVEQMTEGALTERKFVFVPPPARDIDGLRPYLLGERAVSGPIGEKPLFAAFVLNPDQSDLEYWSDDVSVEGLRTTARSAMRTLARQEALTEAGLPDDFIRTIDQEAYDVTPKRIRSVEEQETTGSDVTLADRAPLYVSVGLAYFLWLMIFSVIQYLLMGTIEERSNKIFDTLLTSVRLPQMLAGKLLAVFAVTSTMMLVWGAFSLSGSVALSTMIPGAGEIVSPFLSAILQPSILLPALISFVLGYLLYGVLFLALGSLCDTIQEAQTLLSPMMILLMLPMFAILIAFNDPGSPIVEAASWFPLFTPFLLILRVPHDPPLWEVIVQIALMAATTLAVLWGATKVYRAGAVHGAGVGDLWGMVKGAFGRRGA